MCAWPGSSAALEQAARLAGPDARVTSVQALLGGTHARTTLIQTVNPELQVVLREFPPGDDAAGHEIQVLRGALGPRGFDVGWCRLDRWLLHGERVADRFLDSYQAVAVSARSGAVR